MKVTAILKGTPDKDGRRKVYIRINDGEKRKFHATQIRVTKDQFEKGKVIKHAKATEYNTTIRKLIIETEAQLIKKEYHSYSDADFFKYCLACMSEWEKEKRWETIRQYKAETTKIKKFNPSFKLSDITPDFLKRYRQYCAIELGNGTNTQWKTFKFLRLIIRKAHKEKLIKENPFDVFDMPVYRDPHKIFLSKKEIDKFEQYGSFVSTWFTIGCYTGLRYGDMRAFSKEKHIKGGRLIIYTSKTGELVSLPLSDRVKALFKQIDYRPLDMTNQAYNRSLKEIAKELKIKQQVTGHTSRHSFAIKCAEAGISQEVTAKLLGHSSLKSTAIYYKITNPRIDFEIMKIYE
jgi:integrase/recombinase XerD